MRFKFLVLGLMLGFATSTAFAADSAYFSDQDVMSDLGHVGKLAGFADYCHLDAKLTKHLADSARFEANMAAHEYRRDASDYASVYLDAKLEGRRTGPQAAKLSCRAVASDIRDVNLATDITVKAAADQMPQEVNEAIQGYGSILGAAEHCKIPGKLQLQVGAIADIFIKITTYKYNVSDMGALSIMESARAKAELAPPKSCDKVELQLWREKSLFDDLIHYDDK